MARSPISRRLYGYYIHKQWSADTEMYSNLTTDVQISSTTIVYRDSQSFASYVESRMDNINCLYSAFLDAYFPSPHLVAAAITSVPMVEVVRMRRSLLRLHEYMSDRYPYAYVVLRIYHKRGSAIVRGPYEYTLTYRLTDCTPVTWDFGSGTPGRPRSKGQKTLEVYT